MEFIIINNRIFEGSNSKVGNGGSDDDDEKFYVAEEEEEEEEYHSEKAIKITMAFRSHPPYKNKQTRTLLHPPCCCHVEEFNEEEAEAEADEEGLSGHPDDK